MNTRAARRYAKALFLIARDTDTMEAAGEALERLRMLLDDPAVWSVARNPLLDTARRLRLAGLLSREVQGGEIIDRFLGVLAEGRRLDLLPAIAAAYQALLDRALGRVRARITSARPLDEASRADLVAALEKVSSRTVVAESAVDPELLAGVVVEMESRVYDGSLRSQLRRLAGAMAGGELED